MGWFILKAEVLNKTMKGLFRNQMYNKTSISNPISNLDQYELCGNAL